MVRGIDQVRARLITGASHRASVWPRAPPAPSIAASDTWGARGAGYRMSWREAFVATLGPGYFGGTTPSIWLRVLRDNQFAVDLRATGPRALRDYAR